MMRIVLGAATASLCFGHVVSLSSGELEVHGRTADYTLRMPAYEIEHVADPATALLKEVRFGEGRLVASNCARENTDFVCHATYAFEQELPDKVEVECTLYRATVPNHIHMLYARQSGNTDQRVFDQNASVIEMRFHPPSFWESLGRDGVAGMKRFVASLSGLLFIVILALSARSWKEAFGLGTLFLISGWIVQLAVPFLPLGLSAEFVEAVMGLSTAYLAGELLFVPGGRAKWFVVPVFGLIQGLPFVGFPALYLTGAQVIQIGLLGLLYWSSLKVSTQTKKAVTGICLVTAVVWFARFVIG